MSQDKRYGFLVSRLNNPVTVNYNGEALQVPPRATRIPPGKTYFLDKLILGPLPEGVKFIGIKDEL